MERLIDCSLVQVSRSIPIFLLIIIYSTWFLTINIDNDHEQPYTTNAAKVVFLKERPHSRPFRSSGNICFSCDRSLQDGYQFCSIACKVYLSHYPQRKLLYMFLPHLCLPPNFWIEFVLLGEASGEGRWRPIQAPPWLPIPPIPRRWQRGERARRRPNHSRLCFGVHDFSALWLQFKW